MEIKAKCKFDMESTKALIHLTMFKKADPQKRMILWSVTYLILFAIIILELIAFGSETTLLILLGVEVIWLLLMYHWYFMIPKIRYKALANLKDAENEYIFSDSKLKVSTNADEYNGSAEIEYSFFAKAFETSKFFFLYQTNNQVFVVDKATIEGGTAEIIRNKLKIYIKDKYIVCKY